jgi:integrase
MKRLPVPATGRSFIHDTDSPLTVQVTATGARTFYVNRRVNGKPVRVRVAAWPDVTVERARKLAAEAVADINRGVNPLEEKRRRRADASSKAYTVGQALAEYADDAERGIGRSKPLKAGTVREYRRQADKALGHLAALPLADLNGRHIDELRRTRTTSVANGAVRLLRAACNHAADRDMIDVSPLAGRKRLVTPLAPRKGHVPEADLGRFLACLEDAGADDDLNHAAHALAADALQLMVLYGLRSNEARSLPTKAIDAKARTFTITDTKNSDPLTLPITPVARRVLDRRVALARRLRSRYVFPSFGTNHMAGGGYLAEPRHALDRVREQTGIDVTPHDLRRTFASMAAKRLPHAMVKAVLNHRAKATTDITLDYVQVGVDDMREPLEALHARMDSVRDEATR